MKRSQHYIKLVGLFIICFLGSCGGDGKKEAEKPADAIIEEGVDMPYIEMADSNRLDTLTKVKIETTVGNLLVALYDETPLHRDNFLKLAKNNFYDNTLFHRVIKGFMVQGGDPESKNATPETQLGSGGPGYKIPNEIKPNLYHVKGALAAARQGGKDMEGNEINPEMKSSGSQFYIVTGKKEPESFWENMAMQSSYEIFFSDPNNQEYNLRLQSCRQTGDQVGMQAAMAEVEALCKPIKDSLMSKYTPEHKSMYTTLGGAPALDMKYTVFGYLISGYETLSAIENTQTAPGDRPMEDIKILKCTIIDP